MAVTEGKKVGDFVKYEGPMNFSREVCVVAVNQTIVIGQVCMENEAGEKLVLDASGELADCVALENITTAGALGSGLFLVRHAICRQGDLSYGLAADAKAVADAYLKAVNIIVRT